MMRSEKTNLLTDDCPLPEGRGQSFSSWRQPVSKGGVVGLAVGFGGAALLGHLTGWTTATPVSAVAIAVGFSAAVGVFFGYYPARKAAALNPIQALRYE